jgi:UDP-galactopyranose mutase
MRNGSLHSPESIDVICLSHLRWNFVYQRPQHLLSRCALTRRVHYVEEPVIVHGARPHLRTSESDGVRVVAPVLPEGLNAAEMTAAERTLLDAYLTEARIDHYLLWYYTPMALRFTAHLSPRAIIYDCMDELAAFKGAPAALGRLEADLLGRASLVFTGGQSLYEAKKNQHRNIHPFPSSVDVAHFARARQPLPDPVDQSSIGRPRLGFFGVIDERLDVALLRDVAEARPNWQFVMIGPVVKIDPATLPRRPNIHYLGGKRYSELPEYISAWDVALMPFARNESTRFISPTKTPEYMAAGKPVVSTSIRDVVRPYGDRRLVRIADDADAFVEACEAAMEEDPAARLARADAYLSRMSWDRTWTRMQALINDALLDSRPARASRVVLSDMHPSPDLAGA